MWTFPTGAPANAWRDLPVFSTSPNWKDGVLERLSWLTDVMSSEIAVEQRRGARRFPRRSFECSFLRVDSKRSRLDNFMTGVGRNLFLVPLWQEQFKLPTATVDGTVQFPAASLQWREFFVGDLVLLSNGDPNRYAVLQVMSRNTVTDRITLAGVEATGTWPEGSRITPLRRARITDTTQMSNASSRVGAAQIRFDLADADPRFIPSWGYCSPLWRFNPDRSTPLSLTYERSAFMIDMEAGVVEVQDPGNRAQISTSMGLVIYGREEIWKFRSFLYMARGRARRFYVPTFSDDIQPTEDLGGLTFDAQVNGFSDYMEYPQEARRIIAVVFKDARPTVYRNVVGTSAVMLASPPYNQVAERFTLDQDMPPIRREDIARVMFVVPSRFDQDTIEVMHVTDSSKVIKSSVVVRSSVVEGMPPIECWVTSRPYPVESVESVSFGASLLDGSLISSALRDDMAVGGVMLDGEIRPILRSYTIDAESTFSEALLLDGEIRQILRTYNAGFEDIGVASAMLNGDIRMILVQYARYNEDLMKTTATLLDGTLT